MKKPRQAVLHNLQLLFLLTFLVAGSSSAGSEFENRHHNRDRYHDRDRHHNGQGEKITQPKFANPPQESSIGGVLDTELVVNRHEKVVAGRNVLLRSYNGLYIPQTLRVNPGDTLYLRLINKLSDDLLEHTNLHTHGWNVSPQPGSDDIFMQVPADGQFNYSIFVPKNHPQGLYWYHPHGHLPQLNPDAPTKGNTEFQIMSGMSGGLIVDGILDPFPGLKGIQEQVLLLKDIQITDEGTIPLQIDSNAGTTRMVNGLVNPRMKIRPGELQFWRVGNIGPDIYYKLTLDRHEFFQIARDGNRQNRIWRREEILLPPSSRVEFFIRGEKPGVYTFRTQALTTGPAGDQYPEATLATLVSSGHPDHTMRMPRDLPPVEDFRDAQPIPPGKRRSFVFSEDNDGNSFFVNEKQFNINRVDFTVPVGFIEEWTIQNVTKEFHVFHIHQTDFQVVEINGVRQEFIGHQDTVNIPFQTGDVPGEVKVLIDFRDPIIVGKFVAHCHIGAHEDNGMMAVVEVVNN
ncbi:MAG: oxidoreductase [Nitrospirales bacterium]|nr:MAG: oxidoreductase [Nitrospirales bacterium]